MIDNAHRLLESAEESLRLTRASLNVGTMTLLDVLQAESTLADARLRNSEAIARFDQAQINLVAALGMLDTRSLGPLGLAN
ncbi:MAG: TolC family protein [Tepidisphaeraceae bacterium]